ncbi:MAG: OmpA family protein [Robiginitomaculum sp.]|nr:OmpA family protein [Robiginitomaculum sp.]
MKLQLLTAAASVALLAVPTLASASDAGWYVRGNVGYGVMTDVDLTGDLLGNVQGEGNAAGSLGVGYAFGNNWRMELDATQLWNDMGAISQAGNTSSDMRITTGMLNAIYDFSDFGSWEPYIGAGIGIARGKLSAATYSQPTGTIAGPLNSPTCPGTNVCTFSDSDTGVAWQLLAGLGYKITDNLTWDTQYRYLNAGDFDFTGLGQNLQVPVGAGVLGTGSSIATSASGAGSHSILTGLRYRFGAKTKAAPPPPPTPIPTAPSYITCNDGSQALTISDCPKAVMAKTYLCSDGATTVTDLNNCPRQVVAPAPPTFSCPDGTLVYDRASCPIRQVVSICDAGATNFVVYFPWDKSQLTDQAKAVVANAAGIASQCGISNIIIEGHADSSGAQSYNLGLSSRRANRVESELRTNGITTSSITKSAKGETALAVNTGDGVREPLNRRTEVVIRLIPGSNLTR